MHFDKTYSVFVSRCVCFGLTVRVECALSLLFVVNPDNTHNSLSGVVESIASGRVFLLQAFPESRMGRGTKKTRLQFWWSLPFFVILRVRKEGVGMVLEFGSWRLGSILSFVT